MQASLELSCSAVVSQLVRGEGYRIILGYVMNYIPNSFGRLDLSNVRFSQWVF